MSLRRDSGRLRLLPARSIEETGLDPSLFGGFLSPQGPSPPLKEPWGSSAFPAAESPSARETHAAHQPQSPFCPKCRHEEEARLATAREEVHANGKAVQFAGKDQIRRRRITKGKETLPDTSSSFDAGQIIIPDQEENRQKKSGSSNKKFGRSMGDLLPKISESALECVPVSEISESPHDQKCAEQMATADEDHSENGAPGDFANSVYDAPKVPFNMKGNVSSECVDDSSVQDTSLSTSNSHVVPRQEMIVDEVDKSPQVLGFTPRSSPAVNLREIPNVSSKVTSDQSGGSSIGDSQKQSSPSSVSSKLDARSRWKRAAHSVKFINHLASNIRVASTDLIEGSAVDEMMQQQFSQDDAGRVGAATFEGARTVARARSKGRKGMEGLIVKQDRGLITFFQDFYVACLKLPIGHFLAGVLLAPLVLGLVFTPLYLLDVDGLSFNGVVPEDATTSPFVSAKQRCLAFLNIFLYALSLSTTFGGAPVAARSPLCLLVANVNTLLAQFLFVFLSGAVFARMSQPSYPIRCSKKAIIKTDDLSPVLGLEQQEKFKVFAIRLVLTGPPPCELVDAKICLTFRIFVTLPSGYVFCSTQDLEVVRPEVSYLRYGLMVRHIIDKKSPVHGHTMESLLEGDASFSLTVMGVERTSMQPVFHLEDYFVCDDEVIWEADYEDFIRVDGNGQRILDHSRIDLLKPMKAAARAAQAVSRMKHLSHRNPEKEKEVVLEPCREVEERHHDWPRNWFGLQKRKLLKSLSTSFTRANW